MSISFEAGTREKARQLLGQLENPVAYVPVEISGEYLEEQARELRAEFPTISIRPVVADFTQALDLPTHPTEPERNLIFFPGSTIGNFPKAEARALLKVMRAEAKSGGALLIGVDLIKAIDIVVPAYNDAAGITAAFNLNVLEHLNKAIGTDFDTRNFRHQAVYDNEHDRIEMRLVVTRAHKVLLDGQMLSFAAGEYIVTEHSHKYSIESFRRLAIDAGWQPQTHWVDDHTLFSVHFLAAA